MTNFVGSTYLKAQLASKRSVRRWETWRKWNGVRLFSALCCSYWYWQVSYWQLSRWVVLKVSIYEFALLHLSQTTNGKENMFVKLARHSRPACPKQRAGRKSRRQSCTSRWAPICCMWSPVTWRFCTLADGSSQSSHRRKVENCLDLENHTPSQLIGKK